MVPQHLLIWLLLLTTIRRTHGQSCKAVELQDTADTTYPFDNLPDDRFTTLSGTPAVVLGQVDTAVYLNGRSVISLGTRRDTCFFDPTLCVTGATLAFWLKYDDALSGGDDDAYVFSNGGQRGQSYGWAISIDRAGSSRRLDISVSTKTAEATIRDNNWDGRDNDWHHLVLVIDVANNRLTYYEDGTFLDQDTFNSRTTLTSSSFNEFVFGAPNHDIDPNKDNGQITLDEMLFWESPQDALFVSELYQSYVSNLPECVYPATCLSGECTCPDGSLGLDCNAVLTFTTDPDSSATIAENTQIEFSCTGDSDPLLNLWLHDLTSDTDVFGGNAAVGTFTASETLDRTHNGHTYACRATGTDPAYYIESAETYTFNVEYIPLGITFTTDTSTVSDLDEDTLVAFTCTVDANPAPLLSLWSRDESGTEALLFEQTSAEVTYTTSLHLTKQHHRAVFFCRVAGTSYTFSSDTTYTYTIKYAAEGVEFTASVSSDDPVIEDAVVTLTCSADSYPDPGLAIYSLDNTNNAVTLHTDDTLVELSTTITLTKDHNADDFYCTATGTDPVFSLQSTSIRYDVTYVTDTVQITTNPASPVSEGTVVQIDCLFDANPLPTLSVRRNDGLTEERVTDQSLTASAFSVSVAMTRHLHEAEFFCTATGPEPEYNKESTRVTYEVTYDADEVTITAETLPDVAVLDNTEVEFTCTTDGNPAPLLSLHSRTTGLPDVQQDIQTQAGPVFTTSVTMTSAFDEHDFLCKAAGVGYTIESDSLTYRVTYSAQNMDITTDQPASTVNEDTEVTFTCTAEANPLPELLLMFTDSETTKQISEQSVTGLTFSVPVTLTREHYGGEFFCRAVGEDPSYVLDSESTITYNINYPALIATIATDPLSDIDQPVNAVVQITCSADAYPLPSLALWMIDTAGQTQIVYNHPTTADIFATAVTLDESHNGQSFFCKADGALPSNYEVDSQPVSFNVQYEAPNVILSANANTINLQEEGKVITFTCTVNGNPVPHVSVWNIDENGLETMASGEGFTDLVTTFGILLNRDHNGKLFFCKATNEELQYTIHSNTLEFSVGYVATSVDMVTSLITDDPVEEDALIQFACNTDANPEPVLSLMALDHLGTEYIVDNGEVTLELQTTINAAKSFNGHILFCKATAQDGSYIIDSEGLPLTVYYSPEDVTIATDTPTATAHPENTAIEITCSLDANPLPVLSLVTIDENLLEQPLQEMQTSLEFTTSTTLTRLSDGMSYLCKAEGKEPDYVLYSESLVYSVTYEADTVSISVDPPSDGPQPVDTIVMLTCKADGYPPPLLSLYQRSAGSADTQLDIQPQAEPLFTTSITLTEDLDQIDFLCKAEGIAYTIESETVSYRVVYTAQNIAIATDTATVSIDEDTEVTFTCTAEANPHPVLSLMFADGDTTKQISAQSVTGLTFSVPVTLTREHHGREFFCRAVGEEPSYVLDSVTTVTYNINYPATFATIATAPLPDMDQPANAVVQITCLADAYPLPSLALWLIDTAGQTQAIYNHPTTANAFTTSVTLDESHNGQSFFCKADGALPSNYEVDSQSVSFNVQYEAPNVILSANANTINLQDEGKVITFTCTVDGNPVPHVSVWNIDENGLETMATGEGFTDLVTTFDIALNREHNGKPFFCKATNEELQYTIHSNTLEFSVGYPATSVDMVTSLITDDPVEEDALIQFACNTDANPEPVLSLMALDHLGTEYTVDNGEVTLELQTTINAAKSFNGHRLFCKATAQDGSYIIDSEGLPLTVYYSPQDVTIATDTPTDITRPENTPIEIACSLDANPLPVLSLVTIDENLLEQPLQEMQTSLEFTTSTTLTRLSDGMSYLCKAEGKEPDYVLYSESLVYSVSYEADTVSISVDPPSDDPQPLDTIVMLTCEADGNPPPLLSLYQRSAGSADTQLDIQAQAEPLFTTSITLTEDLDQINFLCKAEGIAYTIESETVSYRLVYTAQNIAIASDTATASVNEDTKVTFTCTAEANPHPVLSLMFTDGDTTEQISEQSVTGLAFSVLVTLRREHHGGEFFCRAVGEEPSYVLDSESTITYNINYIARATTITTEPSADVPQPVDAVVAVTCAADANPLANLSLILMGTDGQVTNLYTHPTIAEAFTTFVILSADYNDQQIFCRAEGSGTPFQQDSESVAFDVQYAAPNAILTSDKAVYDIYPEGTEVVFTCTLDGNPLPYLSLFISDEDGSKTRVSGEGFTAIEAIFTTTLNRDYNGKVFFCKATNDELQYTKHSSTLEYTIGYNPSFVQMLTTPSLMEPIQEGDTLLVMCSTDSYPPPTLSLIAIDGTDSEYVVDNGLVGLELTTAVKLSKDQNGDDIFCRATAQDDSYTIDSEIQTVVIHYAAETIAISSSTSVNSVYPENTEVEITCTVEANPAPKLSVIMVTNNIIEQHSEEYETSLEFTTTVILTRLSNEMSYLCKAEGSEYILYSESLDFSVTYSADSVTISGTPPADEALLDNSEVEFTCEADGKPSPVLALWTRTTGSPDVQLDVQGQAGPTFSASVSLNKDFDGKKFLCKAEGEDYVVESDTRSYRVIYTAQSIDIMTDTDSTDVAEGSEVTLTCTVEANPRPQLSLMFTNGETTQQIGDQSLTGLTFSVPLTLTREHNGDFFCRAVGEDPSYVLNSPSVITYNVLYDASETSIMTEPMEDIPQPINGVVEITCSADSNPLSYLSVWLITNDNEFVNVATNPEATDSFTTSVTLTEVHNEEQFFCRAMAQDGNSETDSKTVQFQVLYRAPTVLLSANTDPDAVQSEDTEVLFTCTVDGNPIPQLSLYIRESDGLEIPTGETSSDASASFSVNLNRNHNEKVFFCKATNEELQYTLHSNSMGFSVQYAATDVLLETDTASEDAVEADTVVHFTCTSDAKPAPLLSVWAVDQSGGQYNILNTKDQLLTMMVPIMLTKDYNKHLFFCRATGEDGSYSIDSNTIRYYVEYAAEVIAVSTSAQVTDSFAEGSAIEITCSVDAYPPPKLSFLAINGAEVQQVSEQFQTSLEFVTTLTLTRESNGLFYYCKAEGTEPEYVLYSTGLQFDVKYAASVVSLTASHSTEESIPENTGVMFTCTTDSNPSAQLSLLLLEGDTAEEIDTTVGNTLTTTVFLEEQHSGGTFYCRAQGTDPQFSTDAAETYTYTVDTGTDLVLPLAVGLSLGTLLLLGLGITACVLCNNVSKPSPASKQPYMQRYYGDRPYVEDVYRKQPAYQGYFTPGMYI